MAVNQARISQILGSIAQSKCGCEIDNGAYTKLCAEHAEIRRQAIEEAAAVARQRVDSINTSLEKPISKEARLVLTNRRECASGIAAAILRLL